MPDTRLLQIFMAYRGALSGVFEVSADVNKTLYCTCPGYASKSACRHTKIVRERMEEHDGKYPFDFIRDVTKKELNDAMKDAETFRKFIIDVARVEAL